MVLAVILARRGSRRVPGKNGRLLAGWPLLEWTLAPVRTARRIDRVVLSTDDPALAALVAPEEAVARPVDLAGNRTPDAPCLLHALDQVGAAAHDLVVHLRPTAPFRRAAQIDDVVDLLRRTGADAAISVRPVQKHPAKCYTETAQGFLRPATGVSALGEPDQTLPRAWAAAGFIDACRVAILRATGQMDGGTRLEPWPVPPEQAVDLDTEADWAAAERLALERGWKPGEIM